MRGSSHLTAVIPPELGRHASPARRNGAPARRSRSGLPNGSDVLCSANCRRGPRGASRWQARSDPWPAKPHRTSRRTSPAHHCQTFPCMSYSPQEFGFFPPTGWVLSPEFAAYQAYSPSSASLSPKECRVLLPARQAYSHWASVGNANFPPWAPTLALSFSRNCWQSSQLTFSTGFFGPLKWLGLLPMTASHCSCVTGYFPMENGLLILTRCGGFSSKAPGVLVGRAHHELAGGKQNHLQLHAVAQIDYRFLQGACRHTTRRLGILGGYRSETADAPRGLPGQLSSNVGTCINPL